MEKLSIEEKAKAYDEAKARMSRAFNSNRCTLGFMNEIFPELKEIEDEKVRKTLVELVKCNERSGHFLINNVTTSSMLAWLEKQKTKKNEWLFEKGKWYVKLQHHYEGDLRHFEKGHVYQALSEVEITDGYHNVSLGSWEIPEYFRPATKDEIPEETKQTSRLDEDEEIRNYFINAVKEQPNIHQEWKEKCLNWLEKQGWKKPTEWCEEDEKNISQAIYVCHQHGYTGVENWLKSLKQKYIWKPSNEQMHAFEQVYDWYNNNFAPSETLTSLYDDLKKLKGE